MSKLKAALGKAWGFFKKYLMKPFLIILALVVPGVLILLGLKKVNIGGLWGRLFGNTQEAENKPNTIPDGRVDDNGAPIPIGTPDEHGVTQAVVVAVESSNDSQVVIKKGDEKVIVPLPEGVPDEDVRQVIVVQPVVNNVVVTNTSKVSPAKVTDLLSKYGK